ncbi:unnamed protein product [Phytophthora fragariaefolia]|uniref:Unnamed protein product n=1 Tax=Phytophthora fragariaefolia TaxID=1490495 RepID=A0A9W6Y7T5_9STRA|nr:unnamed protein product [Phytophthora fragariaefolia]
MRLAARSFLALAAVAVGRASAQDAANELTVACSGQVAVLKMESDKASYSCESGGAPGNKTVVQDFAVNLQATSVSLDIRDSGTLNTLAEYGGIEQSAQPVSGLLWQELEGRTLLTPLTRVRGQAIREREVRGGRELDSSGGYERSVRTQLSPKVAPDETT